MSTDTLSKSLGAWKAQIANVKARLPQLPQLEETVQSFDALVLEAEELQSTQDVHRSKLKETTADRLRKLGHAWKPYRSIACWYLWRSLDNEARPSTAKSSMAKVPGTRKSGTRNR